MGIFCKSAFSDPQRIWRRGEGLLAGRKNPLVRAVHKCDAHQSATPLDSTASALHLLHLHQLLSANGPAVTSTVAGKFREELGLASIRHLDTCLSVAFRPIILDVERQPWALTADVKYYSREISSLLALRFTREKWSHEISGCNLQPWTMQAMTLEVPP